MTLKLCCPGCALESEIVSFEIDGNELALDCPGCGCSLRVARTGAVRVSEPQVEPSPAADVIVCPKCGDRQSAGTACRSCGLLVERMADYQPEVPEDDAAAELWAIVEEKWEDDDAHEAYLARIVERGAYAAAARRYRQRARSGEQRAQAYLDRVGRMAQIHLARPDKGPADEAEPFRGLALLLALLLVVAGAVGAYAIVKLRGRGGEPPAPTSLGGRR